MIDETEFDYIMKGIKLLQREEAEASGADKEAIRQMKKKFKCDNLKKARTKLKKLEDAEKKCDEKFSKFSKEFRKTFGRGLKALEAGDERWFDLIPTRSKSSKRRKSKSKRTKKGSKGRS